VTAQSILVQAEAAGLTLRPNGDNIGIKPVARLTPELKQAIAACKPEVLALLRTRRQEEISRAWAAAYGRLECQFSNGPGHFGRHRAAPVNAWNGAEANAEHVSAEYVAGKGSEPTSRRSGRMEGAVTKAMVPRPVFLLERVMPSIPLQQRFGLGQAGSPVVGQIDRGHRLLDLERWT